MQQLPFNLTDTSYNSGSGRWYGTEIDGESTISSFPFSESEWNQESAPSHNERCGTSDMPPQNIVKYHEFVTFINKHLLT